MDLFRMIKCFVQIGKETQRSEEQMRYGILFVYFSTRSTGSVGFHHDALVAEDSDCNCELTADGMEDGKDETSSARSSRLLFIGDS